MSTKNKVQNGKNEPTLKLPSSKHPDEGCSLDFGHGMKAETAHVMKVHFSPGRISYDVEALVPATDKFEDGYRKVRFYNVDEAYII